MWIKRCGWKKSVLILKRNKNVIIFRDSEYRRNSSYNFRTGGYCETAVLQSADGVYFVRLIYHHFVVGIQLELTHSDIVGEARFVRCLGKQKI